MEGHDEGVSGFESTRANALKVDTSNDLTRSQVASNFSYPMPKPGSGDKAAQDTDSTGSGSLIREMSQDRGSSTPEESFRNNGLAQTEPMETSNASNPTTILFDLNSMPEEEPVEQGLAKDMCDLSLKLSTPATLELSHPICPTGIPPKSQGDNAVTMREESAH